MTKCRHRLRTTDCPAKQCRCGAQHIFLGIKKRHHAQGWPPNQARLLCWIKPEAGEKVGQQLAHRTQFGNAVKHVGRQRNRQTNLAGECGQIVNF